MFSISHVSHVSFFSTLKGKKNDMKISKTENGRESRKSFVRFYYMKIFLISITFCDPEENLEFSMCSISGNRCQLGS